MIQLTTLQRRLLEALESLDPGAARGTLLPMRDVRASLAHVYGRDELLLELARVGALSLHRHDYVAPMSRSELSELLYIPDETASGCGSHPRGVYFVGVAIRQN